jgi:hypothetical protein
MPLGKFPAKAALTPFLCLIASAVYAGAWTRQAGSGLYIQNASYYFTNKFFDNSGNKKTFSGYGKYELNPYLEYGLSDRLTIGSNIFLQRVSQTTNNINNQTNWGIGDSEFFSRLRLWQKNGFIVSAEPMVKLPSLVREAAMPQIGNRNFDAAITLSGGYGYKAWQLNHFVNIDIGYNHRFGSPHDQVKFSGTAGFSVSENWMVIAQVFNTSRFGTNIAPTFTESSADDYNLTKLQISAIYKIDSKLSLQTGIFSNIAGRNSGAGNGVVLAVLKTF